VHPQRSVITRALGTDPDVDVDTFSIEARSGDVFLICSDGLSSYVDGDEIEQLVSRNRRDLEAAAKTLIQAANRGGGDDNITAVLFAVGGVEPEERTREYAVVPDRREPELEDTLHPEDGVPVVSEPVPAPEEPEHEPTDNTVVIPAATIVGSLPSPPPAPEPEAPEAGLGRRLLASVVIVLLVALIVFLAWWGLAR
jgi:PPM family protein phosphatase